MYLTYDTGLKFTLTEFEALSLRRITKYMDMMEKQRAREHDEIEKAKHKH